MYVSLFEDVGACHAKDRELWDLEFGYACHLPKVARLPVRRVGSGLKLAMR
jgi:hypothetical protein